MIKIWESLPRQIKKFYRVLVTILVIAILIENPFGSAFITSLTSQEFFLTHIKDIADYADKSEEKSDYYLATGTYENQIDGDLFGIAEGRNLIIVQMESMQSMMLESDYYGQEITPFLNSLIDEPGTFYFDNFYCQLGAGNTSDAEFVVNNSIIGSIESYTYQLYQDNYFKGLPWILKEKGYNTNVFHGYKKDFWNRENVYPTLGFDNFYGDTEFVNDNIEGIGAGNIVGISDSAFFDQTVDYMKELEEPYYSFVITLSTHNPFGLPEFLQEIELRPEEENIVGRYIQSANYSDRCLEEFFDALKEEGLYDNSLIIMYGDHFGLTRADTDITKVVSDWRGEAYTYDEMLRVPLFVHIPGYDGNERISVSGAQWDIFPTASYLLGIEELDTLYMGQNLLTAESGFVPFQMHMLKGSFVMDDVVFEMSRDGVFRNSSVRNRITGESLNPDDYYDEYLKAMNMIDVSQFYLENDVLKLAILEGKGIEQIDAELFGNVKISAFTDGFEVSADDEAGIKEVYEEIVRNIREDDGYYAALLSDDTYNLMTYIQDNYSGKTGKKGTILSVDESMNEDYLLFREHVYPVTEDIGMVTKIDYLGYNSIIVKPVPGSLTVKELSDFVSDNHIAGILVDETTAGIYANLQPGKDIMTYFSFDGDNDALMRAKVLGIEGIVDFQGEK